MATVAALDPRSLSARRSGLVDLAAIGIVLAVLGAIALPVIQTEAWRDWWTYEAAADHLRNGLPLYGQDGATGRLLYPPAMAAIWRAGFNLDALLALDVIAVALVGGLAFRTAVRSGVSPRRAALVGVGVSGLMLVTPAVVHDAILGNVMTAYAGAIALALTFTGWRGAVPLGIVMAVALKPFIIPFMVFLLVARPHDGLRVVATGAAVTVLAAATIGPSRYVEYIAAIPTFTSQARPYLGNAGLAAVDPLLAWTAFAAAVPITAWLSRILDGPRAAAAAIALGLLGQPSLGLNYASVIVPALVVLWPLERLGTVAVAMVGGVATLLSPVIPATMVAWLAVRPLLTRSAGRLDQ
jgi:hypothetical protein